MRSRRRVRTALLLLGTIVACAAWFPALPGETTGAGPAGALSAQGAGHVAWRASYANALKEAKSEGKPVLLVFYTTWCTFCEKMHHTTLDAPPVVETIGRFVPAMVDAEMDLVAARRFSPVGYPVVVVVDPEGREVVRFVGYQPAESFGPAVAAIADQVPEFRRLSDRLDREPAEQRLDTLRALGDLFASAGFPERALDHYEKALKKTGKGETPEREALLERAGEASHVAGRNADAERYFEKLLNEFPGSPKKPDHLLGLGRALISEGRRDTARTILERIEADHAGSPQAIEALRLLTERPN